MNNNHFTEMRSGSEAGSYLRLIDSFITQLKAQGPSRTCNESKEEEKRGGGPSQRRRYITKYTTNVYEKNEKIILKSRPRTYTKINRTYTKQTRGEGADQVKDEEGDRVVGLMKQRS